MTNNCRPAQWTDAEALVVARWLQGQGLTVNDLQATEADRQDVAAMSGGATSGAEFASQRLLANVAGVKGTLGQAAMLGPTAGSVGPTTLPPVQDPMPWWKTIAPSPADGVAKFATDVARARADAEANLERALAEQDVREMAVKDIDWKANSEEQRRQARGNRR